MKSASDPRRVALVAPGQRYAFALVASLFLSWALANSLNDVLVRHFRKAFDLSRGEAGLVQSAFYAGYFCAALPAGWMMRRHGYKAGILIGLALFAAGALLFWPAAVIREFPLFLGALTVIALGLACLETAANAYVTRLGDPRTAAARLTLAQGFNGLGAVLGPWLGGMFILSGVDPEHARLLGGTALAAYRATEARAVIAPYVALAGFVLMLFALVRRAKLPSLAATRQSGAVDDAALFARPQLVGGIVAQFAYVAAQVCVWSYFIDFAREQLPALPERQAAFLLSSSLALLMIGRFIGAALLRPIPPATLLAVFAVINVTLCTAAALVGGGPAVAALWATSFFMSIMFPTIFALGLDGPGDATRASAYMIMAVVGGAVVPPMMGALADAANSLRPALGVPAVCFAVVAVYAVLRVRRATAGPPAA